MLTSYQRKLNDIERRVKERRTTLEASLDVLTKRDAKKEDIAKLQLQLRHNDGEITEFLLDALPFLREYSMQCADQTTQVRLTFEFQRHFNCIESKRHPSAAEVIVQHLTNDCDACKGRNSLVDERKSATIVCTLCGLSKHYAIPDGVAGLTHEQRTSLPPAPYTYKPLQHFIDMLNNVEARASRHVPPEIIDTLAVRFDLMRVRRTDIMPQDVRLQLREIHACKYYENIYHITRRLNPTYQLVNIPEQRKQILKSMFREVYPRFFRNARKVNPLRKNFLSYPFVAFKRRVMWWMSDCNCAKSTRASTMRTSTTSRDA